jgi:hypothetical protein
MTTYFLKSTSQTSKSPTVIVVGGIGVYYVSNSGGGNENVENGGENIVTEPNATSLQFEANVTSQGATITYKLAGKNMGTTDVHLFLYRPRLGSKETQNMLLDNNLVPNTNFSLSLA